MTSFEYRLHPVGPTVLAGPIYHALEDAPAVLRFYRDFIAHAPDELTTIVNLRQAPPLEILPAEIHGSPVVSVAVCWAGAIDTLVEQTARITSPRSYTIIFHLGGEIARVGEHDTAYSQRDSAHNVNINAAWLPDDPRAGEHVQWARECFAALEDAASGREYVNFLGDEGQDRVRAAYGEQKHARLAALKRHYDPATFFRLNHNVEPAARSRACA